MKKPSKRQPLFVIRHIYRSCILTESCKLMLVRRKSNAGVNLFLVHACISR